ncbi:MAG: hypothetical protein ACKVXR_00645 [Planctomycetota bacterium]
MDLVVEVPAPAIEELAFSQSAESPRNGPGSAESELRSLVERAIALRRERQGEKKNGALGSDELDRFAELDGDARALLGSAARRRGLSARAIQSLRRVARTVADLEGARVIGTRHLAQAIALRAEIG